MAKSKVSAHSLFTLFPIRLLFLISLVLIFFSGCSSSGDGGGTPTISYNGVTTQATVTDQNANLFFAALLDDEALSSSGSLFSSSAYTIDNRPSVSSPLDFNLSLKEKLRALVPDKISKISYIQTRATRVLVDDRIEGTVTGVLIIQGDVSSQGTGVITLTYNNFNDGDGETIDGSITVNVSNFDVLNDVLLQAHADVTFLRLRGSSYDFAMSGTMDVNAVVATRTETILLNIDWRENSIGRSGRLESISFITVYENLLVTNWVVVSESVSGRLYLDTEGYVDVDTVTPMICSGCNPFIPTSGGPVYIFGFNSKAQLILVSNIKVRIEVDSNGDDIFESYSDYYWGSIAGDPVPN